MKNILLVKLITVTIFFLSGSAFGRNEERLKAYEPNYFVARFSESDENASRAHYSFLYELKDRKNTNDDFWINHEVFVSYTGEFDFYWLGKDTRPSAPVVNRINNPALHWRKYFKFSEKKDNNEAADFGYVNWTDISFEHKSNGQAIDMSLPINIERAQYAYDNKQHQYVDSVSRSLDYIGLQAMLRFCDPCNTSDSRWYLKLKIYLDQESEIPWGPKSNRSLSISDFDRVNLLYTGKTKNGDEYSFTWTVGDKGVKHGSFDADYEHEIWSIPFYIKFHSGPLNTLSNYSVSQKSIGIGVKLVPWFQK